MTKVDKSVNVPPMPEHVTLTINRSLDEPTEPRQLEIYENADYASLQITILLRLVHLCTGNRLRFTQDSQCSD